MRVQLFEIKSDDPTVLRKGRLLQRLSYSVLFLSILNVASTVILEVQPAGFPRFRPLYLRLPISILFILACLWLVRNGRIRRASHLFCGGLNLIFLIIFIYFNNNDNVQMLPYLLLVGIVSIAVLDSVRTSVRYTIFFGSAILIFYIISDSYNIFDFFIYLVTLLGVSVTIWATSQHLKDTLFSTELLTRELKTTNAKLETRANQLQLSAAIIEQSSYSLNLQKLLDDTVHLILDQYNYYHVSIFLLGANKQHLYLREASGEIGEKLKQRGYKIPISNDSIICWSVKNRKPRMTQDVQVDPIYHNEPLLAETKSELSVPLIARGEVLGVLDVQSKKAGIFLKEDISILQIMANQVAINIDNANLFAETQSSLNESQTLNDLNTLLTTTLDVGEIFRRAAREFTLNLNVARTAISEWNSDSNILTVQAEFAHDTLNNLIDEYVTKYESHELSSSSQSSLHSHNISLYERDDPTCPEQQLAILERLNQQICLQIPLVYGVQAIGVVELFRTHDQPEFSANELQLAKAMASQTAVALNNAIVTSNARGQVAQFSSLHRLSNSLSQSPTLKEIFDGTRREILSLVEASGMSISLLSEDGKFLNWIYGYEFGQELDLSIISPRPISEGFMGQVARTREIFEISNTKEVQSEYASVTVGADLGYWVGFPMIVANQLIGVLAVENDTSLIKRDIDLLTTIVGPVAIAINNLIQFEEVQSALQKQLNQRIQLQTAAEVAASATSILGLQELMQKSVDLIKERFGLYYVGLFLVDSSNDYAILKTGTGNEGEAQLADNHQLTVGGKSLIGGATGDGLPRITQDVTLDKEWMANPHLPKTRSELALPLRVRGQIIGALTVQSIIPNIFDPELISTLQTMADQLAVAIQNSQYLSNAEAEAVDQQFIRQISTQLYQSGDVNQIVNIGLRAISQRLGGVPTRIVLGKSQQDSQKREEIIQKP
ncbi:MAG: GAF domain-containing protein [Chloroflexi bacterium]|nr:GAF domain-containing protein [Chloroflexota bacterium]